MPALPERLSEATEGLLRKLGVVVHTNAKVAEVLADGVRLADGRVMPAELVVWAAGVKAPDFLKDIDGLETNRINQLVVNADAADHARRQHLRDRRLRRLPLARSARTDGGKGGFVPPRAQAAHQQASHMVGADPPPAGRPAAAATTATATSARWCRWANSAPSAT